jgi:hypothetical protein
MAGDVYAVWDDAAVKLWTDDAAGPVAAMMDRLADGLVLSMKYRCPVSDGSDPDRIPGTLRNSITKFRQPDGSYLVGPTATTAGGLPLGPLVEDGTPPHIIESHGAWPLRNKGTGQVFGRVVHHPGTRPQPFIAAAAQDLPPVVDIP